MKDCKPSPHGEGRAAHPNPDSLLCCRAAAIPGNIFVLTRTALKNRSLGIVIMLGLFPCLIGHSLAVAFGIAGIFSTQLHECHQLQGLNLFLPFCPTLQSHSSILSPYRLFRGGALYLLICLFFSGIALLAGQRLFRSNSAQRFKNRISGLFS